MLAEAHTSLGFVRFHYDWDWLTAGAELQRGIELNPNYALAHEWYASYLAAMGQVEEALEQQRQAKQLDPLSLKIAGGLVWQLTLSRRYDRAIEHRGGCWRSIRTLLWRITTLVTLSL